MPTTPYMIVTMAQLIMMSGKLDKLDKIGEYNDTHERVLWLDPRGGGGDTPGPGCSKGG